MGLGGKKNGELLQLAEMAGFQVLITVDRNIPYQQNLDGRKIALLIMEIGSNNLKDLRQHVPTCLRILRGIKPGEVVRVE